MQSWHLTILVGCGAMATGCAFGKFNKVDDQVAGAAGALSVGGESSTPAGTGGTNSVAGGATAATAGTSSGGGAAIGGTANSSGSGGIVGIGGTNPIAGAPNTGGAIGAGGVRSTGGAPNTGGVPTTGGAPNTGGVSTAGAPPNTGGRLATGGAAPSTGGRVTTGGVGSGGSAFGGVTTGGVATGGVPSSTGGTATGGVATGGCPGTGGPSMVRVPEGFCIDSTEVTRGQYDAWLNKSPAPALPPSNDVNCGWKSTGSYAAFPSCITQAGACQGTGCSNHPQVCVDWCDAYAYCVGVGKRLCGKIGGGTNAWADYASATSSQWYAACSSGGTNLYPYSGVTLNQTACNGPGLGLNATAVVGSIAGCQANPPYAGVYDLSGNVSEWEDSCDGTGLSANCRIRGGSYGVTTNYALQCGFDMAFARVNPDTTVGFRCCSP